MRFSMTHNNFIYIAVMALVSYAIRVLPLTLIRKPIKNQFIQSFLYYVPYVTLAVMTFPAIVEATQSPVAGAVALVVGILAAWFGASLFRCLWHAVRLFCDRVVFVEFFACQELLHLHLTHSHCSQCCFMAFRCDTCAAGSNDFDRDLRHICLN